MTVAIRSDAIPRRAAGVGRELKVPLVAAFAYYLGAEAAFFVGTLSDKIFAPLWPPNIVLLGALLLSPYRRWWLVLLAVFPAHVIAELGIGMGAAQLLLAFATNAAVAIAGAAALRRLIGGPPWFGSLRHAGLYLLITAVVAPAAVALAGAFVPLMSAGSTDRYWSFWAQWYLSNAVGSVALGPLMLILLSAKLHWRPRVSLRQSFEVAFLAAAVVIACAIGCEASATAGSTGFLPAMVYLPLPFVLWAAVRFGTKGASGAILLVTVTLIWQALNGPSPFLAGDPETSVLAMQSFILGLSVPILLLAAAIEEARRAERSARENEERMTFAAVSAGICMWHIDYQSDRFWLTSHGRKILGLRPNEIISRHAVMGIIHRDDRAQAIEKMRAAAAAGRLIDCEFRIVRPNDGEVRWLRCRASAHGYHRGAPAEISGTLADITEQKLAENELAQQRHEIAHLSRVSMLGELSGGIAHELTQPLSAILSNAEAARILLARTPPDVGEAAEAIDDIISEDHRAADVIRRLRGLLRKSEAKFEPLDVNAIVEATLRLLNNELITRRVEVTTDLAPGLPAVSADAVQMQQVLLNLVLNAVDAMSDIAPSRRGILIRTAMTGMHRVQISVADRGAGLTPAQRERVFQPFFTTKESGLGLGLPLCSAIIKLHGGTMSLDNNTAGGATATFTLPALTSLQAAE